MRRNLKNDFNLDFIWNERQLTEVQGFGDNQWREKSGAT